MSQEPVIRQLLFADPEPRDDEIYSTEDFEGDVAQTAQSFLPFAELDAPSPYHPPSTISRARILSGATLSMIQHQQLQAGSKQLRGVLNPKSRPTVASNASNLLPTSAGLKTPTTQKENSQNPHLFSSDESPILAGGPRSKTKLVYAQPRYLQSGGKSNQKPAQHSSLRDVGAPRPSSSNASVRPKTTNAKSVRQKTKAAVSVIADKLTTEPRQQQCAATPGVTKDLFGTQALEGADEIVPAQSEVKSSTIDRTRLQEMREKRMANYFVGHGTAKKAPQTTGAASRATGILNVAPKTPRSNINPIPNQSSKRTTVSKNVPTSTTVGQRTRQHEKARPAQQLSCDEGDGDSLNSTVYQQPVQMSAEQTQSTKTSVGQARNTASTPGGLWSEQTELLQLLLLNQLLQESIKLQQQSVLDSVWSVSTQIEELRQRQASSEVQFVSRKEATLELQLRSLKSSLLGDKDTFKNHFDEFAQSYPALSEALSRNAVRMPTHSIERNAGTSVSLLLSDPIEGLPKPTIGQGTPTHLLAWKALANEMKILENVTLEETLAISKYGDSLQTSAGLSAVERSLVSHQTQLDCRPRQFAFEQT